MLAGSFRALALAFTAGSMALGVALIADDAAGQKPAPAAAAPAAQSGAAKKKPTAPDAGDRYDPENITGISQFMETAVKGTEKYNAKDYPGAVDTFKKAIQLNPRQPLGPYLLGESYLAMSNLGEAEAALKTAEDLSDSKQPLVRSHVLFALADCYEREKKWEDARTAWQTYTEHAAKLGPDGGAFPQSGAARLKAIDDMLKQDKAYDIVRQRIAAEKSDAGADAGKPAAAGAPAKK
jgi:tetratricopeptide (TPR) repeat protein